MSWNVEIGTLQGTVDLPGAEEECAVCGTAHDDEIHQATLRIHRWLHKQVNHDFDDDISYLPPVNARIVAM
ncbi:MAG: hypothetical protein ABI759_13610 [Candidatus Solibacter sp.]